MADILGVYRLVDTHQKRPLYQQDGGANYIFFCPSGSSWVVGTVVGMEYGWARNRSLEAGSVRWPGDLERGWEYRDSLTGSWRSDDTSLRVEPIPGEGRSTETCDSVRLTDVDNVKQTFRA